MVNWLQDLSPEDVEGLRGHSTHREYEPGATIFSPDSHPHSLYLLERGLVRIYRLSKDGAETTFGYVAPGEVFGELPVFGDFPRESFAATVQDSHVWKIPVGVFQTLIESRPGIALEITRQIGQRLKRIESRVENLVFRDVRARVAHILLELAQDFGKPANGGRELEVDFTQAELATLVGSTRQTVNESLRSLEEAGLIARQSRHLVIVKPEELQLATRARVESD
jgi:CRP-like cAMP-binding protein